ncbi:MAG: ATP-binding protein [Candidatus Dormibacteraceae bacterium]
MGPTEEPFEFRATLTVLDQGLDILHQSVEMLRRATSRGSGDRALILFETALGEIGANVLTHGRPSGVAAPVEYLLRFDAGTLLASFTDPGPPVHDHLAREMPETTSEDGRGLVLARSLLDELGYKREGEVNQWRLVKRL